MKSLRQAYSDAKWIADEAVKDQLGVVRAEYVVEWLESSAASLEAAGRLEAALALRTFSSKFQENLSLARDSRPR